MEAVAVESIRETLGRLRGAQKGRAKGAPGYSVYVNRPAGRLMAAFAYHLGWTPNQVTAVSAAFTFSGIAVLLAAPIAPWTGFVVWVLLALGYAWDSADGQVARLRGGGSLAGEWLDHFVDAIKISALHLSVLVGLSRVPDLPQVCLLVPVAFTVVANATFFGMILNDLLKGRRGIASAHSSGGGGALRSIVLLPTDYGVLMLAFVLWGWTPLFVGVYSLLFVACTLFLVLAAVRWFRAMKRIDAEAAAA